MTVTLSLLLATFWVAMHRYAGLDHDARVYAFQALARLHPNLQSDLYLQNTSQDQFTIFSPFYAFFIRYIGLENSALMLTVVFTTLFMAAIWQVARQVGSYQLAWASTAAVIFISGDYGSAGVFHFPEAYLSARLPAYALVATALALHLQGRMLLAFVVCTIAMLVHPIMALPGLLLLFCLTFSIRKTLIGAIAGVMATLLLAVAAVVSPEVARFVVIIDPAWLEVVQERAQFLFLQFWPMHDFLFNARPFLCLAVSALALSQPTARRLCIGALLVGATGLLVTLIGGTIGPIALLVQGQGWRWEWITVLVAVLLLPQTISKIWSDANSGPICSILVIAAWTFPILDGTLAASLALLLWLARGRISTLSGRHLRWAALAFAAVIFVWMTATTWNVLMTKAPESGRESIVLTKLRNILGLGISAAFIFGVAWSWICSRRSLGSLGTFSVVLLGGLSYAAPKSFKQIETLDSPIYTSEFADWRSVIPLDSTVFVAPAQDAGKLVWFSLQRPHYLSPDQSAGVVFSRATALEVKRRSEVLRAIEPPNWKFLSNKLPGGSATADANRRKALTATDLMTVCGDPLLGFVMARDIAGVTALRHKESGRWRGWNLYDCQSIRMRARSVS